jgi:AraC-like DNA-binding protein
VRSSTPHSGKAARRTPGPGVEDGTVRIGVAAAIPAVLRNLGADPVAVLTEAGFDPQLFADPDSRISYAARGRLLAHCVARTGCRHFGLLVGQHGRLSSLGLVGFLVQNAPDLGTGLQSLVRYLHLHVRGAVPSLVVHGTSATLGYDIYQPHVEATDQIGDGAVATMFNILRSLCGAQWKPIEILFAHRRPADVGPFRRFFRAPLRFDAEQNAVVFAAHWLERSSPDADPELRRLLQKQIDALETRHRDDFPEQVRSVLRTALLTGQARADQVATLFSMHSRTLGRRLSAFGTSYRRLVDETGFEIARQMLEDSAVEVNRIAVTLDYADASAFTRAFRRWSGTTPARWRARRGRRVAG